MFRKSSWEMLCRRILARHPLARPLWQQELDIMCRVQLLTRFVHPGLKSVMFGAQSIMLGINDVVIAGGMESMSNIPYYIPKARFGYKYGNGEMVDGLAKDGLWEVYYGFPMGNCADNTAKEMNITREAQDEYAIKSYKRSENFMAGRKLQRRSCSCRSSTT